ncbi:glycosyltransferase family 2 protein [Thalassoroseus pseudoceratinae]|uniref:glycosyltransferase family 2 protein n=1 Tax=Thalassoroseus pseudoceratinae TaxID=2713176 RepID=UPI001421DD70|nr:glycosyltransferase family 2 protein [Thalassoroseus pseudoceratinae]
MISILTALPVYNEADHVADVLAEVRRYADRMVVIDDGSSDATPEILRQLQVEWGEDVLAVVRHEENSGYGAALNTAFQYALDHRFDVLVTIDCDGQHEPKLIPEIARQVFDPNLDQPNDIVSGSRYLTSFEGDSTPPEERRYINLQITRELNRRLGLNLTDAFCGFKAYRVDTLNCLDVTDYGYAMPLQVWVQAVAAGMRIVEFPVPLIYLDEERSFGGSLDDAQRRMAYYQSVLSRELAAPQPCGAVPDAP